MTSRPAPRTPGLNYDLQLNGLDLVIMLGAWGTVP